MSEESARSFGAQAKLFVGIPLSVAATESLGETANTMRRAAYDNGYQLRWVPPVNYHVTLAFLGNTPVENIAIIRDRLTQAIASIPRFDFEVRGFGAFPTLESARVLWAGVRDRSGHLVELAEACASELTQLGFPRESRGFLPHVTVGRVKKPDNLQTIVQQYSERVFSKTWVDFVVLFESVVKSGHYEYVERARFELNRPVESTKRQTSTLQPSTQGAESKSASEDSGPTSEVAPAPDV